MDEYPPNNAKPDQGCSGSPAAMGNGDWVCPVGEGDWSFVVAPAGSAVPETQPAWAARSLPAPAN